VNHIAVVEDSAQDRAVLDSYLEKYQQEKNCHFQITHFSDGDEIALGYKGGYDLILMDIEMTFMDGMSAAEEIRRADPEVLIIFITNSPQYAIKGYAVLVLDYILKPLSYYAFCQRMNHVRELLGRRQKHFLTVPCAGGVQKLDVSDIYYVEICDHDLLFHTKQARCIPPDPSRDVEQKLPPENFFRSSKAYLVNLEHVDGIQDEDAAKTPHGSYTAASLLYAWAGRTDIKGRPASPPARYTGGECCPELPFPSDGFPHVVVERRQKCLALGAADLHPCRNSGFCPALRYPS